MSLEPFSAFITGTDTHVGKTVLTSLLLAHQRAHDVDAMVMKPVQTGCERNDNGNLIPPDPLYCLRVAGLSEQNVDMDVICPYRFALPASPHLAAAQENQTISMDVILRAYETLKARHQSVLLEGAGGVFVPLNERETMLDLMRAVGAPVIVAARAGLGTLNHTLLTLAALREAKLDVAGIVLIQSTPEPWGCIEQDNLATLKRMASAPVWGAIRYLPEPGAGPETYARMRACFHGDGPFAAIP